MMQSRSITGLGAFSAQNFARNTYARSLSLTFYCATHDIRVEVYH